MRTDLLVRIQEGSLSRSSHGSITGQIWLSFDGRNFPETNWSDFPIVVAGWWLDSVIELVEGQKRDSELRFMDGPFLFRIHIKHKDAWHGVFDEDRASGISEIKSFEFTRGPFIESLLACSSLLLRESSERGWESSDLNALLSARERLTQTKD